MSENNEKKDHNVMPTEHSIQGEAIQSPRLMNGMSWLLAGLLLISIVAIVWMLATKDDSRNSSNPNSDKLTESTGSHDIFNEVLATVNGDNVTNVTLLEIMPKEAKAQFVDQAIFTLLIDQETKKANIEITDAELDEATDLQMAEINHMFYDESELEMQLMMSGLTLEGLYDDLRNGAEMLLNLKIEKLFADKIVITDDMVAEYYEEEKETLNKDKQIKASHILVDTEEEAQSILAEIKAGADFAELAKEHSKDGSAEQGGDLGVFGRGEMVPSFEEAAYQLQIDEVSDVVQSDFGYHIIKLTGKQKQFTLEDDLEILRQRLYQIEMNTQFGEWYEGIREASDIDIL